MNITYSDIGELLSKQIKEQVQFEIENLKEELKEDLKKQLVNNFYLSREELKHYLKLKSISSVDNLVRYGLPKYKVGSKTLFKKHEVDEFINKVN